jgi:hypothetical protein
MTLTRERSVSLDSTSGIKRIKTYHGSANGAHIGGDKPQSYISQFTSELSDHNYIARLRAGYLTNKPFKFAVVEKLFQDDLLQRVKDECLSELSFSQKETDIYKVRLDIFENDIGLKLLRSTKLATLPRLIISQQNKFLFFLIF